MALPNILKDFNLFGDGNNWQGQIPELTLPELARRMVEYEGGGMDGPIEVDHGQELMTFEWTAGGLIVDGLFDTFGSPVHDAAMLRFTGSYESDEDGGIIPVEIVVRGRHKTIAMGDASKGDNNTQSITTTLSYYKLVVDGEDIIERDVPGYVFTVRGVDRMAQRRRALGL
ncbi:phage major tail tube protein [Vreelandella neptunia]|uniref:Phage major tail tube protein n=1 Tax=Vreelandella neptunia TaxID=115551 RepID=A0ABZ0YKE9_9GAMM|nr:phage major tail tube protein [Halomonas neptunia]MDN3562120.1 phage major tail tube protein [Halomonas neptunia]WQH11822.1 phage major tail tube protein [Halomonas neptunia]